MYKVAEEHILSGLSLTARIILGLFAALLGTVMIFVAPPSDKAIWFYAFAACCCFIVVACVTRGRVRQFVGSSIGCILFLTSGAYLLHELASGPLFSGRRSEPSVVNAVVAFLAFGIPGIAYAIGAKFGLSRHPKN